MREVVEKGVPKYLDILKENPDSPTDITDPEVQKKIISYLLSEDTSFSYSESRVSQVDNFATSDGVKVLNIPFQIEFTIEKENPLGLAYMAFTYFDLSLDDVPETDLDLSLVELLLGSLPVNDTPMVLSTANVKQVIKDGSVNKTDILFSLDNGQEYFGNVKMVDPTSNLAINATSAKQLLDNGYNENPADYTLLSVNFYTNNEQLAVGDYQKPFAPLSDNDKPLSLTKIKESIINDFRIFKQIEQIQIQFENYSNKLQGAQMLHAHNQNIVLKDEAVFTDAWLSLDSGASTTKAGSAVANFMFGVNVESILKNQSLFSWFYQIESFTNIYPGTDDIIKKIYNNTEVRDFQIIRRAVKELNLNPDLAKDRFEPYLGEDPDPHIGGYMKKVFDDGSKQTFKERGSEISHQRVSKITNFNLNYNSTLGKIDDVVLTTLDSLSHIKGDQLGLNFINGLTIPSSQKEKIFFINGQDSDFPHNADKRFQYGVKFKLKDGVKQGLKETLNSLLVGQADLKAIEEDINMVIFSGETKNFPVVDAKTNQFTPEYDEAKNTNKALKLVNQGKIDNAVNHYLSVVGLFSFDTEYVQISGDESYKIINKLDNINLAEQKEKITNAISPNKLGSAKLFLKFKKIYDDMIASLRALLKEKKSLQSFIGDPNTDGNNSIKTANIVGYEPQKNLIEIEHYFPQTLMSPCNGITGYNYIKGGTGGSTIATNDRSFKVLTRGKLNNIVNRECIKYFIVDSSQPIPPLSPFDEVFDLGSAENAKYNFLTPSAALINGKNYDLIPTTPSSENATNPFQGFDISTVNYKGAMLNVLARAETSKAEYPQVFETYYAFDNVYDVKDLIILENIMTAKSCAIEGESYSAVREYEEVEDPSFSDGYIQLPEGQGFGLSPDSLEEINNEGFSELIEEYEQSITDAKERVANASNLLMHLVAYDEYKYMFNVNLNNFVIKNTMGEDVTSQNLLEKLRLKYDPATTTEFLNILETAPPTPSETYLTLAPHSVNFQELLYHGIPNAIKFMLVLANNESGAVSFQNPFFASMIKPFLGIPETAPLDPSQFQKYLAALYFNFFNIVKVQYLSGFGTAESGKVNLKDAHWKSLSSNQNEEPDFYNQPAGTKVLCRVIPYDDSELINNKTKYLDLPILNKYFFVTL